MQLKEDGYLVNLDTLRFFAAALIVIFHFGVWSWPITPYFNDYFKIANLGVSFFFVLSGFIMFYVYRNKRMDKTDTYNFLISRLTRILPLYFLALAVTVFYLVKFESMELSIKSLMYHVFFIQSWFSGEVLTLNFVNWTLSIEMFFYLLFPILFLFIKKYPKIFNWFTVFFWIISNSITIFLSIKLNLGTYLNHDLVKYFPLLHLNNFLIGMSLAYFYINKGFSKTIIKYSIFSIFIFFLIYPLFLPEFMYIGHHNGLFAPIFALIIIYAINSDKIINKILQSDILISLGKSSYGVYLLQAPVYWFTYLIYKKIGIFETLGENFRFYIYLIILFVVSILSYYLFEKKIMFALRKKLTIEP